MENDKSIVNPFMTMNDSQCSWLAFDKDEKSLHGARFQSDKVELSKLNIFTKSLERYEITLRYMPVYSEHPYFSMAISPDCQFLGFIKFDGHTEPLNLVFGSITISSGYVNLYKFDSDVQTSQLIQYPNFRQLLCNENNEWLIQLNPHMLDETFEYHRLILDDNKNKGRFEYLTESYCPEAYTDSNQILYNELFFDNKLIVFGADEGHFLYRMHIFDFNDKTWTKIVTANAPDVPRCDCVKKIFGTSMNNLFAISVDNKLFLKYDPVLNMWCNSKLSFNFDEGTENYAGEQSIQSIFSNSKFCFVNLRIRPPRENETDDSFEARIAYRRAGRDFQYLFNFWKVLSLKDICMRKLCETNVEVDKSLFERNLKQILPNSLRLAYFN